MGKKTYYQTIPNDSYRYNVWTFIHPDGDFMFFHTERKMKSMLRSNLINIIDEEKKVAQLTFTPKGKGADLDDIFMRTPKERMCVVCGDEYDLTRHHVVPRNFRTHFPEKYKNSNSHDILFLCSKHHEQYERKADILKMKYFEEYGIESVIPIQVKVMSKIKSTLSFILHLENMLYSGNVYWAKLDYKLRNILNINQDCPLTLNQIEYLKKVYEEKIKVAKKFFKNEASSKILVDKILEEGKIEVFIKDWRKHFVDNAKPNYLPIGWDINRDIKLKNNFRVNNDEK
jgi:hypothetical protein